MYRRLAEESPTQIEEGFIFKPLHSEALAVHPNQIPEAIEVAKRKGVPVEFDKVGRPIFTSSRQFREYAKRHGFRHRGY